MLIQFNSITSFARLVILACSNALLGGCWYIGSTGTPHEQVMANVPNPLENFAPGQVKRDEIRKKLGNPIASSIYWGFDLFRGGLEETSIGVVMIAYVPVLPIYDKKKHYRYTLVSYDEGGVAQAVDSESLHLETTGKDRFATINLLANDITFEFDSHNYFDIYESLLIWAPEKRDAYLQFSRSAPTCTLVAGYIERPFITKLSIDREPTNFLMFSIHDLESKRLAALSLKPGNHDIGLSVHKGGFFASSYTIPLSCKAGEIVYLVVKPERCIGKECTNDVKLSLQQDMPEEFANHTLQLWGDGKWLVNPEPGN